MIIGTAGHIDHGKTTLVRALTGVDTDRLPEEKRRGISIELGYAYARSDSGASIGYVDVPGHERLLHTMLAGATGIDHALLLVAADDGVMPQTREHLAVVSLLGLADGSVVITKTDRVADGRIDDVRAEIATLLAGTPLADAPVFAVSAVSGDGMQALRAHLDARAQRGCERDDGRGFRLAVDRAFTLAGAGTVVTGAVHSGRVAVGDELRLMPAGRSVRVRSLHAQNEAATTAHAGQRCALALAGLARDDVGRGDWVCAPAVAWATQRIDVMLTLWHEEPRPLRPGTPVHVHLGAADVMASVALLDRETLAPGEAGLAQLVLHQAIGAWHGDRGVLRDASASRTLAGVRVLDPAAPSRSRRAPERLQVLRAWAADDASARVDALLAASPLGLDLTAAARSLALASVDALPLPEGTVRVDDRSAPIALAPAAWSKLLEDITRALTAFHAAQPEDVGPDTRRLKRLAAPRLAEPVWRRALAELLSRGALSQSGTWLHLPEHAVRLSTAEERIAQQVLPAMQKGGFDPPWVRDLAKACGTPEAILRLTLARLAQRGVVFAVVKDLYYPAATIEALAAIARRTSGAAGSLSAATFRDATGLGRKRAIQILEFFDRVGLTRRVKDEHILRKDTLLFTGPA